MARVTGCPTNPETFFGGFSYVYTAMDKLPGWKSNFLIFPDRLQHIIECKELNKNKNSENIIYSKILNGTVIEKLKIAKVFRENYDKLEKMKNNWREKWANPVDRDHVTDILLLSCLLYFRFGNILLLCIIAQLSLIYIILKFNLLRYRAP